MARRSLARGGVTVFRVDDDDAIFEDRYASHEDATYIATMDPPVALALADWLDSCADCYDTGPRPGSSDHALVVARPILSGEGGTHE